MGGYFFDSQGFYSQFITLQYFRKVSPALRAGFIKFRQFKNFFTNFTNGFTGNIMGFSLCILEHCILYSVFPGKIERCFFDTAQFANLNFNFNDGCCTGFPCGIFSYINNICYYGNFMHVRQLFFFSGTDTMSMNRLSSIQRPKTPLHAWVP